ncbi:aconitase X swivel domain-containing protein [Georgenia alba]|uniref:Aconitase X swivel domain-containing protein n=1 Tax=Georgenia alba TaxID=2233858 RepID=A0ABW2Q710_9MICO
MTVSHDPALSLAGRTLVAGAARGPALVCTAPIPGWGGIDPKTGTVTEITHPERGASFAGRVLVIPGAKGSSGWSGQFHLSRVIGTAPIAVVTQKVNSKLAVGLVALEVPAVQVDDLAPFRARPVAEVELPGDGTVRISYA